MTFLEAAIEVLKKERQPLHYKRLAQLAVERNLLTVVGRTPEITMQQRLNDALKKGEPDLLLTRERPGVYGLLRYPAHEKAPPPAPKPPASKLKPLASKQSAPKHSTPKPPTPKQSALKLHEPKQSAPKPPATKPAAPTPVPVEQVTPKPSVPQPQLPPPVQSAMASGENRHRQHRRDGRGRRPEALMDAAAIVRKNAQFPARPEVGSSSPTASSTPSVPSATPVKPAASTVAATLPPRSAASQPQQNGQRFPIATVATASPPITAATPEEPSPAKEISFTDALIDVLRLSDGRIMHVRQLIDIALKRRLIRGTPPELWRVARTALIADTRAREAAGLRPRVRILGNAHYALAERKLEPELSQSERTLASDAAKLRDATRLALRRRLARLTLPLFEAFSCLLLERLGLLELDAVKQGEGVAYWSGVQIIDGKHIKVLLALRPGEAEIGSRAIAELRHGLRARGFEQGMILTMGSASPEARAELAQAGGIIDLKDGETMVATCAKVGLGIVRRNLPVEALDLELLTELTET